jgi:hypothetical protein
LVFALIDFDFEKVPDFFCTSEKERIGDNGDVFETHANEISDGGGGECFGRLGLNHVQRL